MRLLRDGMVVAAIGQEGTSIAKVVSLVLVFVFFGFQRLLIKRFSTNNIIFYCSIIFSGMITLINFQFIPTNTYVINYIPVIFNKLFNQLPIMLFYILSEIIAVFIVTNFWLMCNLLLKKDQNSDDSTTYSQLFIIAQIGVLISSGIFIIFHDVPPVLISIALIIVAGLVKFLPVTFATTEKQKNLNIVVNKEVLVIPTITALCGIIAGTIDAFTKSQLQAISVSATGVVVKHGFVSKLAKMWFLQAVLSMILGHLLKFKFSFKRFITPVWLIVCIAVLLITRNNIDLYTYAMLCAVCVVGFKVCKYSTHSPVKEENIKNSEYMHSILVFEGIAGRFGKNSIAILLATLFSFGYLWNDIAYVGLCIPLIGSIVWFFLLFKLNP
jgi:hypothetical protein